MYLLGEGGQAWVRFILVKRAFVDFFFFKYQQESVDYLTLFYCLNLNLCIEMCSLFF